MRILLLDCSVGLLQKLKSQGFDISFGTIGYINRIRQLPAPVYEKEIIIYNPIKEKTSRADEYVEEAEIENQTPDYDIRYLEKHIRRGATVLIFVNRISDKIRNQNQAYGWIPFMPQMEFTKDHDPQSVSLDHMNGYYFGFLAPLINTNDLQKPILQKLSSPKPTDFVNPPDVFPLFFNGNRDHLGLYLKRGSGELIILPQFNDNEEMVVTFLRRVAPKLYNVNTHKNIIDRFQSPEEIQIEKEIQSHENAIKNANDSLEIAKESLETARRAKSNTIKVDETATLIINYLDVARQQEDVSLFYLYKIIEAIERKFGSEALAKQIVGCNAEWNLIGRLSNATYADIRHAPKPGEKVKQPTVDQISECMKAAESIICAYLLTLFPA